MSVINPRGEKVVREPKPRSSTTRSEEVRLRDGQWLKIKRSLEMNLADLADLLNQNRGTVARAIEAALADEDLAEEQAVAAEQAPVVDEVTGLTSYDLVYLRDEHPPGTPLGDHPKFDAILRPLEDDWWGPGWREAEGLGDNDASRAVDAAGPA